MVHFDPKVPLKLKELQQWCGSVIAAPLDRENRSSIALEAESARYIMPKYPLKSSDRIFIYHQQYWWRLLGALQENFSFLTRLLGYTDFNKEIAIPFLTEHPPTDFALCKLGEKLPQWLRKNFPQKRLWIASANIDWAVNKSFWTGSFPLPQLPLQEDLALQPHASLCTSSGDLMTLREVLLKESVDYWQNHPLPQISSKKHYFLIYRSLQNKICGDKLSFTAYTILRLIEKKVPLEAICTRMEKVKGIEEELPVRFFQWTQQGIFFDSIKAALLAS